MPTLHSTHFHSSFYPRAAGLGQVHLEGRFEEGVVSDLRRRGHDVRIHPDWSLGRLCAVEAGADGQLRAGADPRQGQAYAAGR